MSTSELSERKLLDAFETRRDELTRLVKTFGLGGKRQRARTADTFMGLFASDAAKLVNAGRVDRGTAERFVSWAGVQFYALFDADPRLARVAPTPQRKRDPTRLGLDDFVAHWRVEQERDAGADPHAVLRREKAAARERASILFSDPADQRTYFDLALERLRRTIWPHGDPHSARRRAPSLPKSVLRQSRSARRRPRENAPRSRRRSTSRDDGDPPASDDDPPAPDGGSE